MTCAPTVEQCIDNWLEEFTREEQAVAGPMLDACRSLPEIAWAAIMRLLDSALSEKQLGMLASGPIEDLLSHHGAAIIDRLEERARSDAQWRRFLHGVWQLDTSDDIWHRVEKAREQPPGVI